MKVYFVLLTLLFCTAASAEERILVPLTGNERPDAHGSIWTTELWAHNLSSETIRLRPTFFCPVPTCVLDTTIESGVATRISLPGAPDGLPPGRILTATRTDGLFLNLRVRDESRAASSMGVEIPLIREGELFASVLSLLNIPGDERFRHTLRIYDIANKPTVFRVRLFEEERDMLISEQTVVLTVNPHDFATADPETYVPSAAQLDFRPSVPSGDRRYYVTVEPLQDASFWAFLTVTNNDTQEVTIITPNKWDGGGVPRQRGRGRIARR